MRMWSAENLHFFVETLLHPQKIGVWVGLSRRRLIGPIFFNGTLSSQRYRKEIFNVFIQQMHDDDELFSRMRQQLTQLKLQSCIYKSFTTIVQLAEIQKIFGPP